MKYFNILFLLISILIIQSCQKQTGSIQINITDSPAEYQEVNIEIAQVLIRMENNRDWLQLTTADGVYNLLDFQNAKSFILSEQEDLPVGNIEEVKFILGNENTLLIDNEYHFLKTPQNNEVIVRLADQKISTNKNLNLLFDFKAKESILKSNAKIFELNPIIELK